MIKASIKYAIICGLLLFVAFWVAMKYGSNPLIDIRHLILDVIICFVFIYFAGREYKTYYNDGFLHFWQGMSIGLVVFIGASLLFGVGLFIFFQVDAGLLEQYRVDVRAFLEVQKPLLMERMTNERFDEQMASVDTITANQLVFSTVGKKLFTGFLITPVVSVILRKKPV